MSRAWPHPKLGGLVARPLDTRVEIEGGDQLARLGAVFSATAEPMEAVNRKENQPDPLRRDLVVGFGYDLHVPLTSVRTMLQALADGVAADSETHWRFLRTDSLLCHLSPVTCPTYASTPRKSRTIGTKSVRAWSCAA